MITRKARLFFLSAAAFASAVSAPASAAVQAGVGYSPWAALSAFASHGSSAALCGTEASSATTTAANSSCVLTKADAASTGQAATPVGNAPATAAATTAAAGIGTLPLFAGLIALAGLAALVLGGSGSGGDEIVARPISPP